MLAGEGVSAARIKNPAALFARSGWGIVGSLKCVLGELRLLARQLERCTGSAPRAPYFFAPLCVLAAWANSPVRLGSLAPKRLLLVLSKGMTHAKFDLCRNSPQNQGFGFLEETLLVKQCGRALQCWC